MWYSVLKGSFQLTLFFLWIIALTYLITLSTFTFIVYNIFLFIFLFWFVITLCGWFCTFIPILKFVFIPWHLQQCRSWIHNKQGKRTSIGFFHPNFKHDDRNMRILWMMIESILKKYQNDIQIILYTGDNNITNEDLSKIVKKRCNIDVDMYISSITLIYLRSQYLIESNYMNLFTTVGRAIGSIILSFEALIRFVPEIYIDCLGYPFMYPCFYYLASIPVISYMNHSIINSNLDEQINDSDNASSNTPDFILRIALLSNIKFISYQIYSYVYGWCERCSTIIYCSSLSTKTNIESIWGASNVHVIYPPYDIKQFLEMPLFDHNEQTIQTIISVGNFREEKNHELQIRAFHKLLEKQPKYNETLKLILIGNIKHDDDIKYFEQLELLVDDLSINKEVTFKLDIKTEELKDYMNQAIIGLNTIPNGDFNTDIIEMMAAGMIVIAHRSNRSHVDIIEEGKNGFLAWDIDSYATIMEGILDMKCDERRLIQEQAKISAESFNSLNFERLFMETFDKILFVK